MGCNTSKESVQPVGDEAKEDVKNGDIPKASATSAEKLDSSQQEKPADKDSKLAEQTEQPVESKDAETEEGETGGKEREEAATRIQAAFRGHHARKSMKETDSSAKQTGTKSGAQPTKEQLQEQFRADDKELCEAASKIQASFRSHMSAAKEQAASLVKSTAENVVDSAVSKMEDKAKEVMNELEGIDLTDPDLHKAATKIQASFRGHKVRQEVLSTPGSNEEVKK
ncbi:IQ calmodulin-binding domain containing protein igloo isoform X1 [Nomia melanderi]|uniref:IQ calmodulin-binding domain containing protein igloo isoform X1 n=1 Tax=Nomia melanderi TaxID=2448451 RepID=UPI003FCCECE7